nr:immunoglobulin light chain junction region [Macaca mulatta]
DYFCCSYAGSDTFVLF